MGFLGYANKIKICTNILNLDLQISKWETEQLSHLFIKDKSKMIIINIIL